MQQLFCSQRPEYSRSEAILYTIAIVNDQVGTINYATYNHFLLKGFNLARIFYL